MIAIISKLCLNISLAFSAAGLNDLNAVQAVHKALLDAIENGLPFEDFKQKVRGLFHGYGNWHLENVFRTNIQTAYNVGRWKQIQEVKEDFPYLMYDAVNDNRTRPTHRALDGKIYPVDHKFWDTWYPPNGYRCRCSTIQMTANQVQKKGLPIETEDPTYQLVEPPNPFVPGGKLPARPLNPDPGFGTNPGKNKWSGLTPSPLDGELIPVNLFKCFSINSCNKSLISKIEDKHIVPLYKSDLMPEGLKDEDYVLAFLKEFGIKNIEESTLIKVPNTKHQVVVSKYMFIHKPDMSWKVKNSNRERYVKQIAWTIINPYEVWFTPSELSSDKKKYATLNFIRLFSLEDKKISGFCVFSLTSKGWTASTGFMPKIGLDEKY